MNLSNSLSDVVAQSSVFFKEEISQPGSTEVIKNNCLLHNLHTISICISVTES